MTAEMSEAKGAAMWKLYAATQHGFLLSLAAIFTLL